MRVMIITVAGVASRFSRSVGRPCLKCLYHKTDIRESLLYHMLSQNPDMDKYVIVGGFRYDELEETIERDFGEYAGRIMLVKNERYEEYGSGYSLYLGLEAVKEMDYEELVFAEGDLWIDDESFRRIRETPGNVITCNREAILAEKSVAFYFDTQRRVHYIFDTEHAMLEVREPFLGIFNSGQVWKFAGCKRVLEATDRLSAKDWEQTNLRFIQAYFGSLRKEEYEVVPLRDWINCNTVSDYEGIKKDKKKH